MVNTFAPSWLTAQPDYWDTVKPGVDEFDDPRDWLDAVEAGQYREGDRGWRNDPNLELPENVVREGDAFWQVDPATGFRQRWKPENAYDAKTDPRVINNRLMQRFQRGWNLGMGQTPQDSIAGWARANPEDAQRLYDAYDEFDSPVAAPFILSLLERQGLRPSRTPNERTPAEESGYVKPRGWGLPEGWKDGALREAGLLPEDDDAPLFEGERGLVGLETGPRPRGMAGLGTYPTTPEDVTYTLDPTGTYPDFVYTYQPPPVLPPFAESPQQEEWGY